MSEPRTDPRPDTPPDAARPAESVGSSERQKVLPSNDILDEDAPSTDESPTIISKNTPRPPSTPETAPAKDELRGRRLAHFELIEQIGVGGMAAVLRARDTQLDRFVALKILPPDLALDEENVKRFHQEARAAAKLDHDNIARVFFCGEDQRLHFIAFEYVEGDNLRSILEKRSRLPVGEALPYFIQVVAGLCHAAERGVVHRDIKPSNIIITPTGRAKLVDMGLARSLEPQDKGLTQSGVTLGTFDYISPEQALEPRDADVRSDIYSLGCTFYHMLTGRPPVPEGTAARKLHHHQHVKPTDPRELVPGLPDEIALILDRMMAKDARQRYQTADDLLQRLVLVARKLGATADGPEGGLFVDALLPTPPGGSRLFVLGALAVAAVVALILFLPPGEPSPESVQGPGTHHPVDKGSPPQVINIDPPKNPLDRDKDKPNPPALAPKAVIVLDQAGLAELPARLKQAEKEAERIEILLKGNLEWKDKPGAVITTSKEVTIKPHPNGTRPVVIRMTYSGAELGRENWAALTIDSPKARVEGLHFEIIGSRSDVAMIGLLLRGGQSHHTVADCEFLQALPSAQPDRPLVSLQAEAGSGQPSSVEIKNSLFVGYGSGNEPRWLLGEPTARGLEAIVRKGPVSLDVSSCAFGPHSCLFHLGTGSTEHQPVKVRSSTLLAGDQTAVFAFDEGASGLLEVSDCLFSRPEGLAEEDEPVIVRRRNTAGTVRYVGQDNRYHNFKTFWIDSGTEVVAMSAFAADLHKLKPASVDMDSQLLQEVSPWPDDKQVCGQLEGPDRKNAFKINERLPELRQTGNPDRVVGVTRLLGAPLVGKLLPAGKDCLIVQKNRNDSTNGYYPSLQAAILASKSGNVKTILIHWDGDLPVPPMLTLGDTNEVDLTIRPDAGWRPVLVLEDNQEPNPVLFRFFDGKLKLEGLTFRLSPQNRFKSLSVVALLGEGHCQFKDCLVTMDQGTQDTALSLATLPDVSEMMKMNPRINRNVTQVPKLTLDGCFIRGDGDLLASRNHRLFELEARNVLAVLKGSLLTIQPGLEALLAPKDAVINVRLTRVTTYLGSHLLAWKAAKEAHGLTPVQISADNCAFLSANTGISLTRLDVPEDEKKTLKDKLLTGRNGCGGYASLYDPPGGSEMNFQPLTDDRWRGFTQSEMSKFRIKLEMPLPPDLPFSRMTADQFKLPEDCREFGVDPKGLPGTQEP